MPQGLLQKAMCRVHQFFFLGHLYEFRKRWIAHQRKAVFEKKFMLIILRILLSDLFIQSTFGINGCFYRVLEVLTYLNHMIFNFEHSTGYDELERLYRVEWPLSLSFLTYVIVQWIEVWWTRRPCVWENMIMESGLSKPCEMVLEDINWLVHITYNMYQMSSCTILLMVYSETLRSSDWLSEVYFFKNLCMCFVFSCWCWIPSVSSSYFQTLTTKDQATSRNLAITILHF